MTVTGAGRKVQAGWRYPRDLGPWPAACPPGRLSAYVAARTFPAPPGGPVPSGFTATSVTFVSAQEAYVLGTAPFPNAVCTSIVRTLDRGASWRGLPAPAVPLSAPGGTGVWGIRFATPEHGFVFALAAAGAEPGRPPGRCRLITPGRGAGNALPMSSTEPVRRARQRENKGPTSPRPKPPDMRHETCSDGRTAGLRSGRKRAMSSGTGRIPHLVVGISRSRASW